MTRQVIEVQADSAAPPEAVWRLLVDVTTWPQWSGFTEAGYERTGDRDPHGVGAVRRLRAGPMRSRERVLAFDPPRRFSYDYAGSLPIRDYRGDVTLTPLPSGTRITWHSEFAGRFRLAAALVRPALHRVLADLVRRLARAAEATTR